MLYMGSQATTDGVMTLSVTFKLGTDPTRRSSWCRTASRRPRPRLPEEVRRLGVTTIKSSPDLTMVVHLLSPNNRYDMTYLRNYAVLNVKDRLARIRAWARCSSSARGDYSMRVWLDPQKVAQRGLSASDVVRAIREQNVQAAAGVVGASPGLKGVDMQLSVNAQGRLQSEEEFGDIIVKTGRRRRRHAAARHGPARAGRAGYSLRSLLDNKDAVAVPVFQAPGSNAIDISDGVRAAMADLAKNMPEGVDLRDRLRPDAVRARLDRVGRPHAARSHPAGGAGGHPVPADLARVHHPAAGRAGVGGRHLRGAAHARLLDQRAEPVRPGAGDRHRGRRRHRGGRERRAQHRGRPEPRDATYQAMREVSGPIIAIALVLVAVFVPLAFISGLTGQFYRSSP
jgi:multidrug efflux pump